MARLLQPGREHVRTEMPAEHAQCQMSPGAFLLSCCKCYAVELVLKLSGLCLIELLCLLNVFCASFSEIFYLTALEE